MQRLSQHLQQRGAGAKQGRGLLGEGLGSSNGHIAGGGERGRDLSASALGQPQWEAMISLGQREPGSLCGCSRADHAGSGDLSLLLGVPLPAQLGLIQGTSTC